MLSRTVLLAFTALLSTAIAASRTPDFTGVGQIRTLYIGTGHEDLGCLTSTGKWTIDESQCGTFAAAKANDNSFHLFATEEGGCGIDVATFKCGGGVKGGTFGTFGTTGPIPGREVLRYAQYGVLATDAADSPPSLKEEALDLHFYSGSEQGKWVWLGWKPLHEEE
ncbi:hypothetical protein C8A00DRAFT_35807 [Chaetomidium leptoderma]|uniref:RNase T2-like C-terminal domain-containing protein n=1 Tax=Chaetomidium leptoderma TaxID=669021 RepID=A0AAN6VIN7_9PEZI|nr:hypothetical protein C8A00DRAFT_35807 [Chaetomidium leptoderma]